MKSSNINQQLMAKSVESELFSCHLAMEGNVQRKHRLDYNCEFCTHNEEEKTQLQLQNRFHKVTRNFHIIAQIFLSAPLGIHKPRKTIKPPMDRILRWSDAALCLSVYTLYSICVYNEYVSINIELPYVQKTLYFAEYWVYLLHLWELIRMVNFSRERFWKFHTSIWQIDCALTDTFGIHIGYDDLQEFLRQHMALILLHGVSCVVVSYLSSDSATDTTFLRSCFVYLLPNVIMHISLLQYYMQLFVIYKRGEKLYMYLEQLLKTSIVSGNSWNISCRHQLNFARNLFLQLEKFTKAVNGHFAKSICLVFLGSFINASVNIYLIYKYLNAWNPSNFSLTAYSLLWICMHAAKMILILYYNQKILNMKTEATILLSSYKFVNQEAEGMLSRFILQLMSDTRSNNVSNILILNMNFITSNLVAVSTIVIYLIQYDITYEALTNTHNSGKFFFNNKRH